MAKKRNQRISTEISGFWSKTVDRTRGNRRQWVESELYNPQTHPVKKIYYILEMQRAKTKEKEKNRRNGEGKWDDESTSEKEKGKECDNKSGTQTDANKNTFKSRKQCGKEAIDYEEVRNSWTGTACDATHESELKERAFLLCDIFDCKLPIQKYNCPVLRHKMGCISDITTWQCTGITSTGLQQETLYKSIELATTQTVPLGLQTWVRDTNGISYWNEEKSTQIWVIHTLVVPLLKSFKMAPLKKKELEEEEAEGKRI